MNRAWLFLVPVTTTLLAWSSVVYSMVILNGGQPLWLWTVGMTSCIVTVPVYLITEKLQVAKK